MVEKRLELKSKYVRFFTICQRAENSCARKIRRAAILNINFICKRLGIRTSHSPLSATTGLFSNFRLRRICSNGFAIYTEASWSNDFFRSKSRPRRARFELEV